MFIAGFLLFILTFMASLAGAWAYTAEECIRCHLAGSRESSLHVSIEDYEASVHGRASLSCIDCHGTIMDEGHMKGKGPSRGDCRGCHHVENRHGIGSAEAGRPACHSCHTAHRILEKEDERSSVHPGALKSTCSRCHPAECGQGGYLSWFLSLQVVSHGKADFSREYGRDNCVGCHQGRGAHGEEHPIDSQECYKCHGAMWGYIHPRAEPGERAGLFAAAMLYQALGLVLIAGGVRFLSRRFGRHRRADR
ncbi:MAG: hypothetical protein AB1512_01320 [Thermodesulfobacteriota bacterium]